MPASSLSRRDFLQRSLALGAAAMLPRTLSAALPSPAATPLAPDRLALLSDTHVSGSILNTSMAHNLTTAVNQVLALPQAPQRVLISGDCAHLTGQSGDYKEYARRIKPLSDAGLPLNMTLGNHDHREHFWDILPKEQTDARFTMHRQSMVIPTTNANWFLLDTLNQDNRESGELGKDQLDWLAAELDAHTQKPALIMLHHDPLRNGKPATLIDAPLLLAIARPRRHVKAMFFGHTHIWSVTQDTSGIHLVNLPALGYTLWMKSFLGWVDARIYSDNAFLMVHALDPNQKENHQITHLTWRA
jgi:Icc protein